MRIVNKNMSVHCTVYILNINNDEKSGIKYIIKIMFMNYRVKKIINTKFLHMINSFFFTAWAAVVYLNFRARSTFLVAVFTVPSSMARTSRCNKVDAVRLYASYRLNLLLLKGQRCVTEITCITI